MPGNIGGSSWAGGAYNPTNGKLYVPSITLPYVTKLVPSPEGSETKYIRNILAAIPRQPNGLPLAKPPYGRITAYNMSSGDMAWMKPIGRATNRSIEKHPSMANGNAPKEDLGDARRIHVLTTPTLLFAAQDGSANVVGFQNNNTTLIYGIADVDPSLKAIDLETGEVVREIPLEHNAYGAPMTYVINNKQYIVLPYGGANMPAGFVAYSVE
jgi:quinoprotein glucose dehydrogenase